MTIRSDEDRPPPGYAMFLFCREFGWKPWEFEQADSALVSQWFGFLNAEAKAGRIRDMQSSRHG